ncbi:MAG: carboxypeptidase-like regulatory domain-containing protein [Kofleriaceae bacterium]
MRSTTRRIAISAGLGVAAAAVAVMLWFALRHGTHAAVTSGAGSGSGAMRAPIIPKLPGPKDGVRITGFVVDGAGLPVSGALVAVELEKRGADRALAPAPKPPVVSVAPVRPFPPILPVADVPALAPPTGADGHFIVDGLAPGRYKLGVTGPGLLAAEVRFVPVPSDEARIVVARQIAIAGTVTDGGKPVPLAMVGIRGDAIGGALEVKTDTRGAFAVPNLPEGRYQVYAWQGALAARAVRVSRLGAGPFVPVELRLEAGAIVVGRVIDRGEGTGLVAAIELRPTGDDQAPRYARSGDDGVFRIEGVPNGRWIADAFAPGYLSPGGVELDAGKGVPELALARGAGIEGKVVDGAGNPVVGATVRAVTTGTNPIEYSAAVDQDRLRRFSGRMAAPTAPAIAMGSDPQLIARGELGVMIGPIPPVPPQGSEVARPAIVVDPTVASAGLVADPPALASDPALASIWTTGSDGRYRIRGLTRGKVTGLAIAGGFAEARSKTVTVETGEVVGSVDIVLSAGTMIIGKVTDQHGAVVVGAEVSAQPEVGSPATNFTDADGLYKIGPVSGQIELHASAYGHVELRRTITLPPGKGATADEHREDLVLEVADATLAGTVADGSGLPIRGAELEVLVGNDGSRRGTTQADGTFALDMLPRGHVRVRITHTDYPTVELDAVTSSNGERIHLVVPLGGAIEGGLLDGTRGTPLAGVSIDAHGPGGATAEATTQTTGLWKLGPLAKGAWKVEVKLPGYLAFTQTIEVPAATRAGTTTVRDIRIDLARGALVGGTVRDARGQRVAHARVVVKSATTEVEGETDAQGEFRIHDAPTGDVSVQASKGEQGGSSHVTVRGGDEVLGLSLEIR